MDGLDPIDCRVRFLSFLGIGQNVQQAAFVMHTAQVPSYAGFKCYSGMNFSYLQINIYLLIFPAVQDFG
jgi:hypothetical protein